jgi:hypothetical protein
VKSKIYLSIVSDGENGNAQPLAARNNSPGFAATGRTASAGSSQSRPIFCAPAMRPSASHWRMRALEMPHLRAAFDTVIMV